MSSGSLQVKAKEVFSFLPPKAAPQLSEQEQKMVQVAKKILNCRGSQELAAISSLEESRTKLKELKKSSQEGSFVTGLAERVLKLSKDKESWIADKKAVVVQKSAKLNIENNLKLFAHMHGDSFIQESGLEGIDPQIPLSYLIDSLSKTSLGLKPSTQKSLQETLIASRETLQKVSDAANATFKECKEKSDEEQIRFFENQLGPLAFDLREAFDQGRSSLLHGGWLKPPEETTLVDGSSHTVASGHAMMYEVLRQTDGKVTFRIYNRGEGTEYHSSGYLNGKNVIPGCLEIQDIDPETFFTAKTLGQLLTPIALGIMQKRVYNRSVLYKEIFPQLGGKEVVKQDVEIESFLGLQESGTCGWKSFMASMRKQMTFHEYKRFIFEIKKESLFGFYEVRYKEIMRQPKYRHLFEASMVKYARRLDKFKERGYIDEETYQVCTQDLFLLAQSFSSSKKLLIQELHKKTVPPAVDANPNANILTSSVVTAENHELLVDDHSPNLAMLTRMAPESCVYCNAQHEPVLMRISFSADNVYEFDIKLVNGEKRWECRQMPGYYLHSDPFVEQLEEVQIRDYLRMQTTDGKERVLLSRHELMNAPKGHWMLKLSPQSKGLVYFDMKDSNKDQVTKWDGSTEARLYLTMRMLGNMQQEGYLAAEELLDDVLPNLKGTPEELAALKELSRLRTKNNDHSPRLNNLLTKVWHYQLSFSELASILPSNLNLKLLVRKRRRYSKLSIAFSKIKNATKRVLVLSKNYFLAKGKGSVNLLRKQ